MGSCCCNYGSLNLVHHQQNTAFKELIDNDPRTIHLFTTNKEVNHKNLMKLINLSKTSGQPVAKLGCQWRSTRTLATGPNSVFRSHFEKQTNLVIHTDLCVGATVAISGQNIVPEVGLYNGARGTIVDFIYDSVCGPNDKQNDHLPKAIIVDFPGFKHKNVKPWDSNNPTVSTQIYDRKFLNKWHYTSRRDLCVARTYCHARAIL